MQGHVHKTNEKKCNLRAIVLHRALFTLAFIKGKVTPMTSQISSATQNASKILSGMFLFSSWSDKRSVIAVQKQC